MVFKQGIALAIMGLACTAAIAQDTKIKPRETPGQKRADRAEARADRLSTNAGENQKVDDKAIAEYFAGKLILMDQSTIQLAQLATEKSTNEKVKQFARMLVEEHTKCSEQLRESAPGVVSVTNLQSAGITHAAGFRGETVGDEESDAVDKPAKGETNPARKPAGAELPRGNEPVDNGRENDGNSTKTARAMTPLHRILTIERQATDNYVRATTEMLSKYDGQDFDMGFLGFTIGSHTWALAELKAMDSVGDEKFQKLISDATTNVEQHMMKAQELSKELGIETGKTGNTDRRTTSEEKTPAPEK